MGMRPSIKPGCSIAVIVAMLAAAHAGNAQTTAPPRQVFQLGQCGSDRDIDAIYGIAGAAKFQISNKLSLSPRLEWLNDNTGMATGTGQQVKEFTLTGTYALMDRLSGWLELRNDWSGQRFFNRGNEMANWKNQPTLLLGMVAIIGPKR